MPRRSRAQANSLDATIVECIVEGLSNVEIADRLHISHHTVTNRLRKIFKTHKVSNRTELAVAAAQTEGDDAQRAEPQAEHRASESVGTVGQRTGSKKP